MNHAINTVNVIEFWDDTIQTLHAFPDTPPGNKAAEACFLRIAEENRMPRSMAEECVENGYWEADDSDYQVLLVHSER